MATVTLNPNDKYDNFTVLSNSNLSVDSTTSSGTYRSVRATKAKARGGTWYFEVVVKVDFPANPINIIGVAPFRHSLNAYPGGDTANSTKWGFGLSVTGNLYCHYNGSSSNINGYVPQLSNNNIVGIAYDLTLGRIWFAINNVWVGGGTPNVNATPIVDDSIQLKLEPVFPMLTTYTTTNSGLLTATFAESDFTYTPPTGFLSIENDTHDWNPKGRVLLRNSVLRCDSVDGGKYKVIETVTKFDVIAPNQKVALFDEQSLRVIRIGFSDSDGIVTFPNLAHDNRPLLLVVFDSNNILASPTVRRVATLTGYIT